MKCSRPQPTAISVRKININMRCIEIRTEIEKLMDGGVININMRCIEIAVILER